MVDKSLRYNLEVRDSTQRNGRLGLWFPVIKGGPEGVLQLCRYRMYVDVEVECRLCPWRGKVVQLFKLAGLLCSSLCFEFILQTFQLPLIQKEKVWWTRTVRYTQMMKQVLGHCGKCIYYYSFFNFSYLLTYCDTSFYDDKESGALLKSMMCQPAECWWPGFNYVCEFCQSFTIICH